MSSPATNNAQRREAQVARANQFVTSLPVATPNTNQDEGFNQCFCSEDYDQNEHVAVRTPCGHVFGRNCLLIWCGDSNSNTCPMCRGELFTYDGITPEQDEGNQGALTADMLYDIIVNGEVFDSDSEDNDSEDSPIEGDTYFYERTFVIPEASPTEADSQPSSRDVEVDHTYFYERTFAIPEASPTEADSQPSSRDVEIDQSATNTDLPENVLTDIAADVLADLRLHTGLPESELTDLVADMLADLLADFGL